MKLRPTARGDWAFIRRWTPVLVPAWVFVGWAAWTLPDDVVHA